VGAGGHSHEPAPPEWGGERKLPGILDGIKVLSWTVWQAGPNATAALGDLGAEIIKIEEPSQGDLMRWVWKATPAPERQRELPGGKSTIFELCNRNTKSVTLDLSREPGRQVLHRMVERCDVFVTNIHRAAKKWGLDYAGLSRDNPRLIYLLITGYGPKGPDWESGGYDPLGQARSGLMDAISDPPLAPRGAILDQATSVMGSYGVVAALLARERFGVGQEVNVSLVSTGINLISNEMARILLGGGESTRHDRVRAFNPLRNLYRCADGRWIMGALTPADRYWPSFCQALGIVELEKDPRFESNEVRGQHAEELISILDKVFASRTSDEWLATFKGFPDLSFTGVNRCSEVADDPQVVANNYLVDFSHPVLGEVKFPGFPIEFSETPAAIRSAAPDLGEHTREVLREMAGCGPEELDRLGGEGVI
jgi:crotonobetainyl-CoA:carnitine CoA-transferase CaiB-like acyl-CoA transferase